MTTIRYHWNTGRLYQRDGQHLYAEAVEQADGSAIIQFLDASRGIDGQFRADEMPASQTDLRWEVMHAYDHNAYLHGDGEVRRYPESVPLHEAQAMANRVRAEEG